MSTTTKDTFRQAAEQDDGSYPKSWIPEPGDLLIGILDHYDTGTSRFGKRTIAVIRDEDTGELRGVWLMASVLEAKFSELEPKPGERLYIKRHADRVNTAGTKYQSYSVKVADRDVQPNFERATEIPSEQKADTESRPVTQEEALSRGDGDGHAAVESFADFPKALDEDTEEPLPF